MAANDTFNRDPRIDAYIEKSAPFAQPILQHLREVIHKAVPQVTEEIKWSRPFFLYNGKILCNLSAFKAHCTFGIWNTEVASAIKATGRDSSEAMGTFGRITSVKDLPTAKEIARLLQQAAKDLTEGLNNPLKAMRSVKPPKAEIAPPAEFLNALKKNKAAQKTYDGFSPSHRREYMEWITEAKREETRDKRIAQAVEWIAEGKQRNWKYQG
ncbi:YdeI/OmpD-associated family protein [Silvibacterium acidisoli]|uniref:YdeI/OmpD-associated family protein n=1 Tax=Acidobacteriaceae bacterium ZG23-2 TaxID=2883246 RepID=UPI00406C3184